jgi:large subunit ribosomal protein L13
MHIWRLARTRFWTPRTFQNVELICYEGSDIRNWGFCQGGLKGRRSQAVNFWVDILAEANYKKNFDFLSRKTHRAMKTYSAKQEEVDRQWYVIDASGCVLGRLATFVATRLRGKHKPIYTPHVDTGDHVIVINAAKVTLTGRKQDQKVYYRHSGYLGGLKSTTAKQLLETRPGDLVVYAVRGMLPKNRLGRQMLKKLKVYAGPDHPHMAQQPQPLQLQV